VPSGVTDSLFVSGIRWDRASVLGLLPLIDCASCGLCCKTCKPIVVQEYEIERIALHTGEQPRHMKARLERLDSLRWSLPTPCPYQREDNSCSIHEVRMVVCKFYPLVRIYKDGEYVVAVARDWCEAGTRVVNQLQIWQGQLEARERLSCLV